LSLVYPFLRQDLSSLSSKERTFALWSSLDKIYQYQVKK
jgi:hypothetical protein